MHPLRDYDLTGFTELASHSYAVGRPPVQVASLLGLQPEGQAFRPASITHTVIEAFEPGTHRCEMTNTLPDGTTRRAHGFRAVLAIGDILEFTRLPSEDQLLTIAFGGQPAGGTLVTMTASFRPAPLARIRRPDAARLEAGAESALAFLRERGRHDAAYLAL